MIVFGEWSFVHIVNRKPMHHSLYETHRVTFGRTTALLILPQMCNDYNISCLTIVYSTILPQIFIISFLMHRSYAMQSEVDGHKRK